MPPKRKADDSPKKEEPATKKTATGSSTGAANRYSENADVSAKYGIVLRDFYPPEISNERCQLYVDGKIPRPYDVLEKTIKDTASQRDKIAVGSAVVHWFKRDLRLKDNLLLSSASKLAKKHNVPLICLFTVSPEDYRAHLTSAARVDFNNRSLAVMKQDLQQLNIPLIVDTVEQRRSVPEHVLSVCKKYGANHVFCGIQYEVDELRREKRLIEKGLAEGVAVNPVHDDLVVKPGALATGQGKQYAVYTPFYRAWVAYVHKHPELLDHIDPPSANPADSASKFKDIFNRELPPTQEDKQLSKEMQTRLASIWPAGEHEALERLDKFAKERIGKYKDTRNLPADNSTSMLSPHFAAGTLSARTAIRKARDVNSTAKLDGGNTGIVCWISEVVWRSFYKHVSRREQVSRGQTR